ncbi:MAG: hypothetical protein ACREGB_01675 [Candidatus Saccharimonadales bacterium]
MIKIGDRDIETVIDEHGTQRLPTNPLLKALWECGALDLNKLAVGYRTKQISFELYLEYYLNSGYPVSGFCDFDEFEHLPIVNPLWG